MRVGPVVWLLDAVSRRRDRSNRPGVRLDLQDRHDVRAHGWYAWSLLQVGQVDEAREAIAPALALGTQDARLLYHAGSIHAAAGERERAIESLDAALELNPYFDVDDAEATRELLDDLRWSPALPICVLGSVQTTSTSGASRCSCPSSPTPLVECVVGCLLPAQAAMRTCERWPIDAKPYS